MDERYQVILESEAVEGMENAYRFIEADSAESAGRWFTGLIAAVESLSMFPNRCPIAPENDVFDVEIRQLLYGKRSQVYRILFTVEENVVHVLHIRHGAQRWMELSESGDAHS